MAKLFFRYGAMGSSKSANALMVEYNYRERGKEAILCKPRTDSRDGQLIIKSRIGLARPCVLVEDLTEMSDEQIKQYACVIVDEAQFCTKAQIEFFVHVVDDLNVPVICYGLRADFRNELFEGSTWLLAWADVIEEIKTVCCVARLQDLTRVLTRTASSARAIRYSSPETIPTSRCAESTTEREILVRTSKSRMQGLPQKVFYIF